ncbi:MAG: 50S ribosomal protein L4, partial [Clostridia bacterium]|nr:50S ribosomal protein L4 [Clostridia bacterium]
KPRSYRQSVNRKVRRLAMRCVLSDKVSSGGLKALSGIALEQPKTREVATILKALGAERKTLIVLPTVDESVWRAARNLPNVQTLPAGSLNVLDLLNADHLIATGDALKVLEEVYSA